MTQLAAEQRAWRILMASFILFVTLCSATAYGVYWFLFQSTVDMKVTVIAARGTVQEDLPDVQTSAAVSDLEKDVEVGTTIVTDATSEAVLRFADPDTGQVIGYLFVLKDSQVRLEQASSPRFVLNNAPNEILLSSLKGKSYMVIVEGQHRPLSFTFGSSHGTVTTSRSGRYAIEVTQDWTKVSVQSGEATLTSGEDTSPLRLSSNQHAYLATGLQAQHPAVDKSLVSNSQFSEIYSAGWNAVSEGEPAGTVSNNEFQGLSVVTIDRGQERWPNLILGHGATHLSQTINADVTNYNSLELQVSFYIQEQGLSTCGQDGSECPLMLRVDFTDSSGGDGIYRHGFYAFQDPGQGWPNLCDTCRSEHERIRMQSWYTFSDNLFTLLPPEQRPQYIKEISFYASGHAYIVHVAQMDLVGSKLRPPNSTPN